MKSEARRFCSSVCWGLYQRELSRTEPEPAPIPGARWIALAHGGFTLVDEEDYESLMEHAWRKGGSKNIYVNTMIGRAPVYIQTMILGVPEVDHRNGNMLDNRKQNLRPATRRTNSANTICRSKTGYKGISFYSPSGTWNAKIRTPSGKRQSLGYYPTPELAAKAYDEAARRIHGEFACVNFPKPGERGARVASFSKENRPNVPDA